MENKHEENSDKVLSLPLHQAQSQPILSDSNSKVKETSKRRVSFNLNHRYLDAKNPWDSRKCKSSLDSQWKIPLFLMNTQQIPTERDRPLESFFVLPLTNISFQFSSSIRAKFQLKIKNIYFFFQIALHFYDIVPNCYVFSFLFSLLHF
jgi:hypothetical protein